MPKALICESNNEIQKNIVNILKTFNVDSVIPEGIEEALNYLDIEDFAFVIVNENYGNESNQPNRIIQWISSLPMYRRRDIMLIVTGQNLKTLDRLTAFSKGANLVINIKDINNFTAIFKRAYMEYQSIYKQFKELLAK